MKWMVTVSSYPLMSEQQEPTENIEVLQVDKSELKLMMLDGDMVEGIMLAPP